MLSCLLPFDDAGQAALEFRDLFNGQDHAGWTNINTADTWSSAVTTLVGKTLLRSR
jgi:hypothetical protein